MNRSSTSGPKHTTDGGYQTPERMALKMRAVPLPDLKGKAVLDIGCDHGAWCWAVAEAGAAKVLGLDRGREVGGRYVDLAERNKEVAKDKGFDCCEFMFANIGRHWPELGKFDVTLCLSMYHHIFQNCWGEHLPIWYWLWRHTSGELLWENPTGPDDRVVAMNVSAERQAAYNRDAIMAAASQYFEVEHVGPALHSPTREVWRCKPKQIEPKTWTGKLTSGGGGATLAFLYGGKRRTLEILGALGFWPFPGSMNVRLDTAFDWDNGYFPASILDCVDRADLEGEWRWRQARFYPVTVNGQSAHVFRFDGESYPQNYLELIAPVRLRDKIEGERVTIGRS